MDARTGVVSRVRRSVEAFGNKNGVWSQHVYTFREDGRAVELGMPSPPQVDDGDEVSVAGEVVNGVLVARVFENHSNGTHGRWAHGTGMNLFLLLLPMMFAMFGLMLGPIGFLFMLAVGVLFMWPIAVGGLWQAGKTSRAAALLDG